MPSFNQRLWIAAAFVALAVIGTIMNSRQVAAQGPSDGLAVRIVNPLPVPVTGASTVSGTVEAKQSGAWIVGLTGQPILFKDANSPALQPFNLKLTAFPGNTNQTSFTVDAPAPVPAGLRLVVEDISVFGLIPANSLLSGVWLVNKGGDNFLLVNPESGERSEDSSGTSSQYGYNRLVRGYYNAGDVLEIQIFRDVVTPPGTPATGGVLVNVYIHGHYESVP